MLTKRVIPCLDVKDGRVVKGVRFANLRDGGSPAELARVYAAQGADELVILDVSATTESRATATTTVRAVRRAVGIPVTVGGGVRTADDAMRLLDAGADMVAVNSAAVRDPQLITALAQQFGRQCTIISIDAAHAEGDRWEVVTQSGRERTGIDAVEWAQRATELGAGEILLTSWDRDGTRQGYDLPLLSAVARRVNVPIIASGGASKPADLVHAIRAGASAVLAASIFHDAQYTVADVKRVMADAGIAVRM